MPQPSVGAPAPSLLVLAGVLVGLLPGVASVQIPPDVVGLLVLPPLLFAAATDVAVKELLGVLRPVLLLAIGLVAFTAAAVAATLHWVDPQVSLAVAFVLGAVLASTDPVAVSALARRLHLPPRLLALVQGESLLNDATSLVLFQVAVGVVVAGTVGGSLHIAGQFLLLGAGGALVGYASAFAVTWLRRLSEDAVLATVITLLTPYIVFALAEALHTSGVTAVVICGLRMSRGRDHAVSGPVRVQIDHVFTVVVFLLESVVFVLIGLELPTLVSRLSDAERDFIPIALAVTAAVVVTRAIWIYPTGYLQRLRRTDRQSAEPPPWRALAVLSWAGTRGVVPLAAALAIPLTTDDGQPFPERDLLLVLAISCIFLTLVVQGLTLEPLVRRLNISQDPAAREREVAVGRHAAASAALARLDELDEAGDEPADVLNRLRRDVEARAARTRGRLTRLDAGAGPDPAVSTAQIYRRLRIDLLAAEHARLSQLRDEGRIGEDTRRALERGLDLEEARLAEDPGPSDTQK